MGIDQINSNVANEDWTALRRCLQQIKFHLGTASGSLMSSGIFDANTILKADADNTPEALEVAAQTLVGRITGGEITALTVSQVQTLLVGVALLDGTRAFTGNVTVLGAVTASPVITPNLVATDFTVPAANTALYNNMQVPPARTVSVVGLLVNPGWS